MFQFKHNLKVIFFALALCLAGCSSDPETTGDLKVLQGRWVQIEVERAYVPDWIEIRGDHATKRGPWSPVGGESKMKYRIEVDEAASPPQIRLIEESSGRTAWNGAYEFEGEVLSITYLGTSITQAPPADWKKRPEIQTTTMKYCRTSNR